MGLYNNLEKDISNLNEEFSKLGINFIITEGVIHVLQLKKILTNGFRNKEI